MATTITETEMASDQTPHTAIRIDNGWAVSWLPNRVLTRNQAITAMTVAEAVWQCVHNDDDEPSYTDERLWVLLGNYASELGITAPRCLALASMSSEEITILNEHRKITL